MSRSLYYEINVSLNGRHFFATDERSIDSEVALDRVIPVILAKFPVSEGYGVQVTRWDAIGTPTDISMHRAYANVRKIAPLGPPLTDPAESIENDRTFNGTFAVPEKWGHK